MSTVRVDELASELGLSPDELFNQLKSMGFDVVNVTSNVDSSLIEMVRDMLVSGTPKERDTGGKRRIVSVKKGEKEPEVEVRLEEEAVEEEDTEITDDTVEIAEPDTVEVEETEEAEEIPAEETEKEEEAVESEPVAEPEKPKKKIAGISMSGLEKESGVGSIGAEIPTVKVIEKSKPVEKKEPETEEKKPEKVEAPPRKSKSKMVLDDGPEKPKKVVSRKGRKPSSKDLLDAVDEMNDMEADVATPDAEEPTLKVVEIKHSPGSQQVRRKEQIRRRGKRVKKRQVETDAPVEEIRPVQKTILITPGLTVSDLAGMTGTKASEIIKILLELGIMATINQTLDPEMAELVASELGVEVEVRADSIDDLIKAEPEIPERVVARPPVITVMGHVDHGKTSLLDAIRETDVVSGEAGGITQHIGAHLVNHSKGRLVFLDTPGHEAFTAMRARGAKVTDIVVLVVAADDGVKPQTVEAIDHAKAAEVPILVAVNKMDKPEADAEKVMRELSEHGVVSEEWGGDSLFIKVSAKKGDGIDDLLDAILLQSEILELAADPDASARGVVVESKLDKGRGPVATVLVQMGTLRPGDMILAGTAMGRVRAMLDDRGKKQDEAGPSMPVEVLGLPGVPQAGEQFIVFTDELKAKRVTQMRLAEHQAIRTISKRITLEDLYEQIQQGVVKDLSVILKADVQGSVEAIKDSLDKQATSEVRVRILHEGTGGINESDVILAAASNAIIIGFNVRPDNKALEVIRSEQVDVRYYKVIYDVVKDIRDALTGLLSPVFTEEILGRAEIREIFHIPRVATIAGCYVTDGLMRRNAEVRLLRDGVVVHEGRIDSLKRFKDDAREVQAGYECGIGLENYNDVKPDDILENFEMIEQEAKL